MNTTDIIFIVILCIVILAFIIVYNGKLLRKVKRFAFDPNQHYFIDTHGIISSDIDKSAIPKLWKRPHEWEAGADFIVPVGWKLKYAYTTDYSPVIDNIMTKLEKIEGKPLPKLRNGINKINPSVLPFIIDHLQTTNNGKTVDDILGIHNTPHILNTIKNKYLWDQINIPSIEQLLIIDLSELYRTYIGSVNQKIVSDVSSSVKNQEPIAPVKTKYESITNFNEAVLRGNLAISNTYKMIYNKILEEQKKNRYNNPDLFINMITPYIDELRQKSSTVYDNEMMNINELNDTNIRTLYDYQKNRVNMLITNMCDIAHISNDIKKTSNLTASHIIRKFNENMSKLLTSTLLQINNEFKWVGDVILKKCANDLLLPSPIVALSGKLPNISDIPTNDISETQTTQKMSKIDQLYYDELNDPLIDSKDKITYDSYRLAKDTIMSYNIVTDGDNIKQYIENVNNIKRQKKAELQKKYSLPDK